MRPVIILGCGPVGLLCAHAAQQAGMNPLIYSRKQKSVIPGSQHLHGPIPGLTSVYPEGTIQFVRLGTAEEYARKVYGDASRETGWSNYWQVYPSWNAVTMYDELWDRWYDSIADAEIDVQTVDGIITASRGAPIISTIPAQAICHRPFDHHFDGIEYFIKKLPTPAEDRSHEIVVYNGLPGDLWYRWSILGGLCSMEARSNIWQSDDVIQGTKALGNNCDCWPEVHRVGRWAEWTHGVTMYSSYNKAVALMEGWR